MQTSCFRHFRNAIEFASEKLVRAKVYFYCDARPTLVFTLLVIYSVESSVGVWAMAETGFLPHAAPVVSTVQVARLWLIFFFAFVLRLLQYHRYDIQKICINISPNKYTSFRF